MGWSEGARLLDEVWAEVVGFVPKKEQKDIATKLVKLFENEDADTISSESDYPILRKASNELNDFDDDEDDYEED